MNHHYKDITTRLGAPLWWDECGVPRYDPFAPDQTNDIYCNEAALVLIACQNCGRRFHVAMSSNDMRNLLRAEQFQIPTLADQIRAKTLHYGDPPNYGCCAAGPTMNCIDIRVLEYWRRDPKRHKFVRDPALEIELDEAPPENL